MIALTTDDIYSITCMQQYPKHPHSNYLLWHIVTATEIKLLACLQTDDNLGHNIIMKVVYSRDKEGYGGKPQSEFI